MDFIISFIKSMSVISVILAAVWMLMPMDGVKSSFKYVIGVFTLSAIISTFASGEKINFNFDFSATETTTETTAQTLEKETLTITIEELLKKEGIEFEKVEIITDICPDDSIHITKAKVWLVNEDDLKAAKNKVFIETGLELVGG